MVPVFEKKNKFDLFQRKSSEKLKNWLENYLN